MPGDNSVDLFTNDLGIIVFVDPATGQLQGANFVAGGGMGRTHRAPTTYPRLADPLGYVPADRILAAVKAVVCVQRDYGRRDDRRQARLKYLMDEWGVDRVRAAVEQYMGAPFAPFKPLPAWEAPLYLGWTDQGDGKWAYGVHVPGGRVKGAAKQALRRVIEDNNLPVLITAQQNLILTDIAPALKNTVVSALAAAGLADIADVDPLDANSMACPALPLCGLAVTEAERALPALHARLRAVMTRLGFAADESLVMRVTGCPNGCARPYMAELGLVGDGPNSYQLWTGGCAAGTRLNELYAERVKVQAFDSAVEPLLAAWRAWRRPGEPFGDCCARVGCGALTEFAKGYVSPGDEAGLPKVAVPVAVYAGLQAEAEASGRSVAHVAADALARFAEKK